MIAEVPPAQVLPCAKRVRVIFGGRTVADSRDVLILRGGGRLPVYYFPRRDVKPEHLQTVPDTTEHAQAVGRCCSR